MKISSSGALRAWRRWGWPLLFGVLVVFQGVAEAVVSDDGRWHLQSTNGWFGTTIEVVVDRPTCANVSKASIEVFNVAFSQYAPLRHSSFTEFGGVCSMTALADKNGQGFGSQTWTVVSQPAATGAYGVLGLTRMELWEVLMIGLSCALWGLGFVAGQQR